MENVVAGERIDFRVYDYVFPAPYLDWALSVAMDTPTFDRITELHHFFFLVECFQRLGQLGQATGCSQFLGVYVALVKQNRELHMAAGDV